jgi:glycosidase
MTKYLKIAGLIVSLLLILSVHHVFAQGVNVQALLHDSRSDLYRTPGGAVPFETSVILRLRAAAGDLDGVNVRVFSTRDQTAPFFPMQVVSTTPDGYDFWEAKIDVGRKTTLLWYRFVLNKGGETYYYEDDSKPDGNNLFEPNVGGVGKFYETSPDLSYEIAVYDPNYYTPEWFRNAIVYQIFPDRFRDGDPSKDPKDGSDTFYGDLPLLFHETWNEPPIDGRTTKAPDGQGYYNSDFYGGDLAGITQKLDYLQSLGVTAIYLNPIFMARSNHRYDTADYKQIDPILGTLDDFRKLVSEADQRGIKLILDGVFNHMSSDSAIFDRYHRFPADGACESLDSPYRSWFYFVPAKGKEPSPCVGKDGPLYYTSWAGFDSIPKLQSDSVDVRKYIYLNKDSVVQTWTKENIGGWRLDAAGEIDDGGADNNYWETFRAVVRKINPEAVIIGEEWNNASQWLLGDQWDSTMNYRFRRGIIGFARGTDFVDDDGAIPGITPGQFDGVVRSVEEQYPPMAYHALMNLVDSHDTSRLLFAVDNDKQVQKLAALTQFSLPGAPTIYYGDEIALHAPDIKDGNIYQDDPYNRAPYPWADTGGGFYPEPDQDMLAFYQQLGKLRRETSALREGRMVTLVSDDSTGVYAFLRLDAERGSAALVVLNNGNKDQSTSVDFAGLLPTGLSLNSAMGDDSIKTDTGKATLNVAAKSGNLWTVNTGTAFAVPTAPTNFQARSATGKVTLTWDSVADAGGYMVYRSPVAVGGFEPITAEPIEDTTYVDDSVTNGFVCYYAVAAVGKDRLVSAQSSAVMAVPSAKISALNYVGDFQQPTTLQLVFGVTTELKAAIRIEGLTEAASAAKGVRAQAALVAANDVAPAKWLPMHYAGEQDGADVYSATLAPQATGDYNMIARFSTDAGLTWTEVRLDDGSLPKLVVEASGDTTPPAAPAAVRITRASLSGVGLAWDAVTDDSLFAYRIYRTGEDGASAKLAEVKPDTLTYLDKSVQDGKSYTYAVTAVDGALNESSPTASEKVLVQKQKLPVTFIAEVPEYTNSPVYIAGDFGTKDYPTWDPGATNMKMTQLDATHWAITLDLPEGASIQYKFVRGTWDAVEKGAKCDEIQNRQQTIAIDSLGDKSTEVVSSGSYIVRNTVAKWRDLDACG